ncbi:hypothetical protein OsJ_01364 [Oryza sativa Japonica Group]|uniref:F-box domain-containing protein n=1 Tax=Oryza sativa subsp. japonica TaxID=39947 RepID=B9EVL4_ORYSJ|nr:hypothetical protein OsJ_01364 [Oryza sativa Japonica Group]
MRKMSAASSGRVKIGDLPDDLLRRVVSLLSARQAVQTSALSRRWRHLWRSAPLLQILPNDGFRTVRGLNEFAKHLLLLRDRAALLDACVINFDCCEFESYQDLPDDPDVGLWLRHAVSCQAQWIRVEIYVEDDPLCLPDLPLVSKHLRVLELKYVKIKDSLVDFSGCPALEHLKFWGGFIHAHTISSPSVKHMIMDGCGFNRKFRTRISVPSLISLQLKHFWGATPFLEDMPLLVTASVSLSDDCRDRCVNTEFGKCGDPGCFDCGANKVIDCDGCVLLQGLSGTSTLELKAESRVQQVYLLQEPYNFVEIEDSDKPLKQAFPFKNLKIVEIKCHEGDERVNTVLKILSQNSVPLEKINVLQTKRRPRLINVYLD